jgi:hypothetical protein
MIFPKLQNFFQMVWASKIGELEIDFNKDLSKMQAWILYIFFIFFIRVDRQIGRINLFLIVKDSASNNNNRFLLLFVF